MLRSPRGGESSADVYQLLSTIHDQLQAFEGVQLRKLKELETRLSRIEAQIQRIEQRMTGQIR